MSSTGERSRFGEVCCCSFEKALPSGDCEQRQDVSVLSVSWYYAKSISLQLWMA